MLRVQDAFESLFSCTHKIYFETGVIALVVTNDFVHEDDIFQVLS
jgi:hypothetical protein